MKKIVILLGLVIVLAACGNNSQENNQDKSNNNDNTTNTEEVENNKQDDNNSEEGSQTEVDKEKLSELEELYAGVDLEMNGDSLIATEDPIVAGDINDGHIVYEGDYGDVYLVKDRYKNDETDEDGFNHVSFDDYEVKYAVALLEDLSENESIGVFVETENGTEDTIQYDIDALIKTDEEEIETDVLSGVDDSEPGDILKGFAIAGLDYNPSDEIEITFEQPLIITDGNDEEMSEEVTEKFTK